MSKEIPVGEINIPPRIREDLEADDLKESMLRVGQLQPILVTEENTLVDGARRLYAAKALRWKTIKVTCVSGMNIVERRLAELEANLKRKDFHWADAVRGRAEFHIICLVQNRKLTEFVEGQLMQGYTLVSLLHEILGKPATESVWTLNDTASLLQCQSSHLSEDIKLARALEETATLRLQKSREAALKEVYGKPLSATSEYLLKKSLLRLKDKYGDVLFFKTVKEIRHGTPSIIA